MKNSKLFFIFPYRGTGGVSILFLRMANYLASNTYMDISIVDYKDGYMAKNNYNSSIKLIEYFDDKEIRIPADAIIIFQTMTPWSIYSKLNIHKETKIFFWNCHPMNLLPRAPIIGSNVYHIELLGKFYLSFILFSYKKSLKLFLNVLLDKKSIAFMDSTNVKVSQRFLGNFNDISYLPIPSTGDIQDSFIYNESKKVNNILRITYVGRVEDFKIPTLKKVISDISKTKLHHYKFFFNIIGEGSSLDHIKQFVSEFKNIDFRFINNLSTKELENFYINNTDLTVAMGTAALDSARCSTPTILLDLSYSRINDNYKYKWIYETEKYNLAEYISSDYIGSGKHTIDEIFSQLEKDNFAISKNSYDYFNSNHNMSYVSSIFIEYINNTKCSWGDLDKLGILSKGIIYKIYNSLKIKRQ